MRKVELLALKMLADIIPHCGDYGRFYIHRDCSELVAVLGDADNPSMEELKEFLSDFDMSLTILSESDPETDDYILISKGVEAEYYDEDGMDEDTSLDDGYLIPRLLNIGEYATYITFLDTLED